MKVEEIKTARWVTALEIFTDGHRIQFDSVTFYLDRANREIDIGIISAWEIVNLNDEKVLSELMLGKNVFEYLLQNSEKFNDVTKGFKPRFSLLFDYGSGTVEICRLENDTIIWNS